jgi:hypothetical protein
LSDTDIGYWWPRVKKVVKKVHKILLGYFAAQTAAALLFFGDHLKWYLRFVCIIAAFKDFHILYEVLEANLCLKSEYLTIVIKIEGIEHSLWELLGAVET